MKNIEVILSSKVIRLDDENIEQLSVLNILGKVVIDMSEQEFINNRIDIKVYNILGKTTIITNGDTKSTSLVSSILSSMRTTSLFRKDSKNVVHVYGSNVLGKIDIE